jgi:hypothetical protein
LYADRGYGHDKYLRMVRTTGVKPVIARRGTTHGSGLDIHRWAIEQMIAPHRFRRLRIRWEIRDDVHEALRPSPRSSAGDASPADHSPRTFRGRRPG